MITGGADVFAKAQRIAYRQIGDIENELFCLEKRSRKEAYDMRARSVKIKYGNGWSIERIAAYFNIKLDRVERDLMREVGNSGR